MLYLSYKPDNSLMEQDATKTMERCIKLKLNEDKTEFMVIGTRPQLGKVSTAKNLGVWLELETGHPHHQNV